MLRYIVMIKHNNTVNIKNASEKVKIMFQDLITIDSLLKIEVGVNISKSSTSYDLVVIGDFKTELGLKELRKHPKHIKLMEYLDNVMKKVVRIDYIN